MTKCCLKHVKSLWLLMAFEKTKKLTVINQVCGKLVELYSFYSIISGKLKFSCTIYIIFLFFLVQTVLFCILSSILRLSDNLMDAKHDLEIFHFQNAFSNIPEKYHKPIHEDVRCKLHTALSHMPVDVFLAELFECILLHISVPQDTNAADFVDNVTHP